MMHDAGKREMGFTLIELMMAVSIVLLITGIAIYNLLGELPSYRLRSSANKIAATLQYLKIRAVATNKIAWLEANYATAGEHYFTGFIDEDGSGTASAAEYTKSKLDLPDDVSGTPCFKLPPTISFGFPSAFAGTGPDNTANPGVGHFITTWDAGGSATNGYFGYRPTGVPVINPAANMTADEPAVIYLTNTLDEGYAVSVQITGRVRVWKWSKGEWQ